MRLESPDSTLDHVLRLGVTRCEPLSGSRRHPSRAVCTLWLGLEETDGAVRGGDPDVCECGSGGYPTTRCTPDEAELHQIWLVDILDRVGLFAHRYRQGREAHGTSSEARDERVED